MSIDGGPQVAALWLQSSQTDGVSHQHGDARRTHFRHDLHSIAFDRSGADLEYVADRRAGVPGDDKVEDLHLTIRWRRLRSPRARFDHHVLQRLTHR